MTTINTQQMTFIKSLANLAYGTAIGEKTSGGKGNMGLLQCGDGRVRIIKCNTHGSQAKNMQARIDSENLTTELKALRDSSDALRSEIIRQGKILGLSEECLKNIGVIANGKPLMTRKIVANFVNTVITAKNLSKDEVWEANQVVKSARDMSFSAVSTTEVKGHMNLVEDENFSDSIAYRMCRTVSEKLAGGLDGKLTDKLARLSKILEPFLGSSDQNLAKLTGLQEQLSILTTDIDNLGRDIGNSPEFLDDKANMTKFLETMERKDRLFAQMDTIYGRFERVGLFDFSVSNDLPSTLVSKFEEKLGKDSHPAKDFNEIARIILTRRDVRSEIERRVRQCLSEDALPPFPRNGKTYFREIAEKKWNFGDLESNYQDVNTNVLDAVKQMFETLDADMSGKSTGWSLNRESLNDKSTLAIIKENLNLIKKLGYRYPTAKNMLMGRLALNHRVENMTDEQCAMKFIRETEAQTRGKKLEELSETQRNNLKELQQAIQEFKDELDLGVVSLNDSTYSILDSLSMIENLALRFDTIIKTDSGIKTMSLLASLGTGGCLAGRFDPLNMWLETSTDEGRTVMKDLKYSALVEHKPTDTITQVLTSEMSKFAAVYYNDHATPPKWTDIKEHLSRVLKGVPVRMQGKQDKSGLYKFEKQLDNDLMFRTIRKLHLLSDPDCGLESIEESEEYQNDIPANDHVYDVEAPSGDIKK